jgi:hypothetical protein
VNQWTLASSSAWFIHRQGHRPLPARRGVERIHGDGGRRVAAGAAQAELEVELTAPSCTHKDSLGSGSETPETMVGDFICAIKGKKDQEYDSHCTWSSSSYVWGSKLVTASLP